MAGRRGGATARIGAVPPLAKGVAVVLAAAAVVLGGFLAGRATDRVRDGGGRGAGTAAAYEQGRSAGYLAGLRDGEAQGLREGRALQETGALPAGSRQAAQVAFGDGYAAGANDVFGGYDGGWALATPYVITLERGTDGVTYRIADRAGVEPGTTYRLCADGRGLCPVAGH